MWGPALCLSLRRGEHTCLSSDSMHPSCQLGPQALPILDGHCGHCSVLILLTKSCQLTATGLCAGSSTARGRMRTLLRLSYTVLRQAIHAMIHLPQQDCIVCCIA